MDAAWWHEGSVWLGGWDDKVTLVGREDAGEEACWGKQCSIWDTSTVRCWGGRPRGDAGGWLNTGVWSVGAETEVQPGGE